MSSEKEYEREWQSFIVKEKEIVNQLDNLADEKRKLKVFEEEVMERTKESLYHVNQLLERAKTSEDYRKRQSLMETFSNQAKVLTAGFQERRDTLAKKEQDLNQRLDDTIVEKRKVFHQMEEARQVKKERNDG